MFRGWGSYPTSKCVLSTSSAGRRGLVRWIVAWSDPVGALAVITVLLNGLVILLGSSAHDQRRQLRRSSAISRRPTNSTYRPSVALPRRRSRNTLRFRKGGNLRECAKNVPR